MQKGLLLLMVSLSLIGITDASYITWEKLRGLIPVCNQAFKCSEVLTSKWANIGPVPISALGILFYLSFFALAIALYLNQETLQIWAWRISLHTAILAMGIFGAIFSTYLLSVMGLILNAWCLYCLISACNCFILLGLSSGIYSLHAKEASDES